MIRLYYCDIQNFGDAVNPILIERLTGQKCHFAGKYRADIIGMGSILTQISRPRLDARIKNLFSRPATVWTPGFIKEVNYREIFRKNLTFAALRGKLSLNRVEKSIGRKLDIPLGDGGLLLAKLLDKKMIKKYAVGLVPHMNDIDNPIIKKLADELPHSIIINVTQPPLQTLEQIASCDFILSSAMHGLIAADSLGIPNKWIEISDKVIGHGYKFRDYYSVFDNYSQTPQQLNKNSIIDMKLISFWQSAYNLDLREVENISLKLFNSLKNIKN